MAGPVSDWGGGGREIRIEGKGWGERVEETRRQGRGEEGMKERKKGKVEGMEKVVDEEEKIKGRKD